MPDHRSAARRMLARRVHKPSHPPRIRPRRDTGFRRRRRPPPPRSVSAPPRTPGCLAACLAISRHSLSAVTPRMPIHSPTRPQGGLEHPLSPLLRQSTSRGSHVSRQKGSARSAEESRAGPRPAGISCSGRSARSRDCSAASRRRGSTAARCSVAGCSGATRPGRNARCRRRPLRRRPVRATPSAQSKSVGLASTGFEPLGRKPFRQKHHHLPVVRIRRGVHQSDASPPAERRGHGSRVLPADIRGRTRPGIAPARKFGERARLDEPARHIGVGLRDPPAFLREMEVESHDPGHALGREL